MGPGFRVTVLAAYNSRSGVRRDARGVIQIFWGMLSLRMTQAEFLGLVDLVSEAVGCAMRCGELARSSEGRVVCCSMGQIMLSHGELSLWFSPEEFEEFSGLVARARQRLADAEPLPRLGLPWNPSRRGFASLN